MHGYRLFHSYLYLFFIRFLFNIPFLNFIRDYHLVIFKSVLASVKLLLFVQILELFTETHIIIGHH